MSALFEAMVPFDANGLGGLEKESYKGSKLGFCQSACLPRLYEKGNAALGWIDGLTSCALKHGY